jgi:hypothetical protein
MMTGKIFLIGRLQVEASSAAIRSFRIDSAKARMAPVRIHYEHKKRPPLRTAVEE